MIEWRELIRWCRRKYKRHLLATCTAAHSFPRMLRPYDCLQTELGPGDGTVNKRSLEACSQLGPKVCGGPKSADLCCWAWSLDSWEGLTCSRIIVNSSCLMQLSQHL